MAEVEAQRPSFTADLSAGEKDWPWKMAFRAILLVFDIVGIGSIAWVLQYITHQDPFVLISDTWGIPWGLFTLPASFIWCFIVVTVLIIRKRPVHPGCVVGIDLILWLAFIVTGLFAVATVWSTTNLGASGIMESSWSSGYYQLLDNNTWVWNASTSYSNYNSYYYGDNDTTRDCSSYFDNCAEQDAYINKLWHDKGRIAAAELLGTIAQFLGVLLHFILFVWGCVDVHRRRRSRTTDQARLIAEKIIQDMTARGQIVPMQQNMTQPLLAPTASGALPNGSSPSTRQQTPVAAPQPAFQPPQQQHHLQQPPMTAPARSVSPVSPVAEEPSRHDPDAIEAAPRQPHAL